MITRRALHLDTSPDAIEPSRHVPKCRFCRVAGPPGCEHLQWHAFACYLHPLSSITLEKPMRTLKAMVTAWILAGIPAMAQDRTVIQPREDMGRNEAILACVQQAIDARETGLLEECRKLELYVNKSWTDMRHRTRYKPSRDGFQEACITATGDYVFTGRFRMKHQSCRVNRCATKGPYFVSGPSGSLEKLCFGGRVWTQNNPGSRGPGDGKWEFCAEIKGKGETLPSINNDEWVRQTRKDCRDIVDSKP